MLKCQRIFGAVSGSIWGDFESTVNSETAPGRLRTQVILQKTENNELAYSVNGFHRVLEFDCPQQFKMIQKLLKNVSENVVFETMQK